MLIDDDVVPPVPTDQDRGLLHDGPAPMPRPRGPLSAALAAALTREPSRSLDLRRLTCSIDPADAPLDEDLQLALWLAYEQHYRGVAGVDAGWEWHPELLWARTRWEEQFLAGLRQHVPAEPTAAGKHPRERVVEGLTGLATADDGPSLSTFLLRQATRAQFAEFLVHRSLYHLKEADPHSWAIPRLSGSVKGALVTIQSDEYGSGVPAAMHAQLFRAVLRDWGLDASYGHYLDRVPAATLMVSNLMSMFGLHRRWRGALVGHLALFEMTSSTPNARYARAHRRLGGSEDAARFFDEHVVADAVHEQIALHDLAGGLSLAEPELADDVLFGARCAAYADALFGAQVIARWTAGGTSLLAAGQVAAA